MDQLKKAVGLSTSGKNDSYTDIDYTLYHRAEGDLYIYENGVYRGIFGTYETGDELSVERLADGTIQYVHNGTVIYTSMQIITVDIPFVADASIYSSLGSTTLEVDGTPAEAVLWLTDDDLQVGSYGDDMTTSFSDTNGDGIVDVIITDSSGQMWTQLGSSTNQDVFLYNSLDDSDVNGFDTIHNFDWELDKIDLSDLNVNFADLQFSEGATYTDITLDGTDFMIRLRETGIG